MAFLHNILGERPALFRTAASSLLVKIREVPLSRRTSFDLRPSTLVPPDLTPFNVRAQYLQDIRFINSLLLEPRVPVPVIPSKSVRANSSCTNQALQRDSLGA